ncbi:septal ring lytic transglycosylase RlpA family protein [Chitinimonas sp. BJB300]|uniref:septal ring lytic transglycosylase RlpA family protein n=1 Tax=Chitinimonas sp. BJB300 TaxID=1559339 RepID=UPI000C0EF604|nr:septal ring lytic transglycosylase RlpA family protein [Chitinimonas sp. BJB300]PHV12637.1 septal ring lytic transglycosylase RlpA family lipoprotein [Chitinimonas sp. BJB300]TSJ91171.1 septal ring lytic transglycosylase RlpA family protein [Chitinimonas sp. BJB300]
MSTYRYLLLLLLVLLAGCASRLPPGSVPTGTGSRPANTHNLPPAKPEQIPKEYGGYYKDDGPILAVPYDLDLLAEPTVQAEPLHRYANRPYKVLGRTYTPLLSFGDFSQEGGASWYGKKFHGKRTSSGEAYDMFQLTAAHPVLPIPSYARVTNLVNGKSVVVRINDRGPFHKGRVIDLSYAAAYRIGYHNMGNAKVRVQSLQPGEPSEVPAPEQVMARAVEAEPGKPSPVFPSTVDMLAIQLPGSAAMEQSGNQRWVQLGAFASQTAAESFRSKVGDTLSWLEKELMLEQGNGVWRVRVGPYPDKAEAQAMVDRIAQQADFRPVVVR